MDWNREINTGPGTKVQPGWGCVLQLTIAINRRFKRDETDFIDVVVFKAVAESCANYLSKGKMAGVSGELQIGNYTNKDGQKVKTVQIIADEVEFLSPKDGAPGNYPNTKKALDQWDDIGREVRLEDIDVTNHDDDEIPF